MKNLLVLFLLASGLALGLSACSSQAPMPESTPPPEPELVINLTSDPTADPHSSLMGMHLVQKALANGLSATVFLNVHGVKLMGEEAGELAFHGENLQEVLQDILDNGGTVLACPHCMEAHDIEADDLMAGVQVSQDAMMMDKLKAGPTVFTY